MSISDLKWRHRQKIPNGAKVWEKKQNFFLESSYLIFNSRGSTVKPFFLYGARPRLVCTVTILFAFFVTVFIFVDRYFVFILLQLDCYIFKFYTDRKAKLRILPFLQQLKILV